MTEIDEARLPPPDDLEAELETFRIDEETAQQFFFSYLGVRDLTAKRPDVLAAVNRNPMFWKTTHYSMFVSTELSPKVGDGGNRKGGISWGCLTPPLLHRRSDMPCLKITSSS